jgi:hypothetical protein
LHDPLSQDEPGSFRIHIRTISTNAAHPLAQEDILHFDIKEFIPETITLYLEVTQNLLIVVLDLNDYQGMRGERVWIWDWTTSYPIMVCYFLLLSYVEFI